MDTNKLIQPFTNYNDSMPLLGNSTQNKKRTLEGFYLEFTKEKSNPVWEKIGRNMLAFIDLVYQTFPETKIWEISEKEKK